MGSDHSGRGSSILAVIYPFRQPGLHVRPMSQLSLLVRLFSETDMEYGVSYPLANGHREALLFNLEKQREDGALCDIAMKVGSRTINAHRGVLSACSDYFSAMFCGTYVESGSELINLTETFHNADVLDRVITSMYSGNLEMKQSDDICDLLETCSILLFDDAKKQCIDCLKTRLCLRNGLQFWFAADKYLPEKQVRIFRNLLENHFHDFYIYLPEISKLSSRELAMLLKQNFHKFCTPVQILVMLLQWFAAEDREHEDLHSILSLIALLSTSSSIIKLFLRNSNLLASEYEISEDHSERFCSAVLEYLRDTEDQSSIPGMLTENTDVNTTEKLFSRESVNSDLLLFNANPEDLLDAVLVIAPTPEILEQRFHLYMYYQNLSREEQKGPLPLFHVSVYVPKIRSWYVLGQIPNPPDMSGEKLTWFFDCCGMEVSGGSLYAISDKGDTNLRCDLESFQWSTLPPLRLEDDCSAGGHPSGGRCYRIVQPMAIKDNIYVAVVCQQSEMIHLGILELSESTNHSGSTWVEKVPFQIPPALFGFTLTIAYHCIKDDRYVFLLVIGRMQSVHCRATCLAKFDVVQESVDFLNVPEEYLMEPYHWTLFEQGGSLYLAHKTTFLYKLELEKENSAWENCSERITIEGNFKLPSLHAKSWGKFRRLNGVAASEESLWVMVERRLVDRWHAITLWEIGIEMASTSAQQHVRRHIPSPYSCYTLALPIKLPAHRLKGKQICKCVHSE